MLFNTYAFCFVFAPVVFTLYWAARRQDHRKWICLLSSYVFYGVWSLKFAGLMLASTSVDYFTARRIEASSSTRARRAWLALSMCVNLGVLGTFKYYDFFARSLNEVAPHPLLPLLDVALPIGISFYTFESMSYTIDVYRRRTTALDRFIDYAHFVTMFPRLVAGPIVRYTDLAAQLRRLPDRLSANAVLRGIHFFAWGLVKKALIADYLAIHLVDHAFADTSALAFFSGWFAALGYTAQLYMDFSGYSDMAVGLGILLGLQLPRNFELPYRSANIGEFWRRWHISLSTWLRDYLYIPLGGNRSNRFRNLFLTMLFGGLWHGANWTFVLWGAYHGLLLVLHTVVGKKIPISRPLAHGLTLICVVVGWVMFRASDVSHAVDTYRAMLGLRGLDLGWLRNHPVPITVTVGAMIISFKIDTYDILPPARVVTAVALGIALVLCAMRFALPSPFLYFQF